MTNSKNMFVRPVNCTSLSSASRYGIHRHHPLTFFSFSLPNTDRGMLLPDFIEEQSSYYELIVIPRNRVLQTKT